jgi:RNA polymerase sigma factor (sigma-70 family)
MPSDDRLVRRAAQGDRRAFAAIYERYHQELYRFCLTLVREPQDAQDALQNTMLKALRGLEGERREIKLKPWLYRIAHNEAIETIRRRRDGEPLEAEAEIASAAQVGTAVENRYRLRSLLADLEELPDRQRAALVMRELGGSDFAEIGAAFDTSAAVARQTVYEARLSLRKMEEGREMPCDEVRWELSNADGRVSRRRDLRAHLRACPQCRAFQSSILERRKDLAAIAPLPALASAGVLHSILGSASGAGGAGGLAGTGAAAGGAAAKAAAGSALVKSLAAVAVVAAGVTAADRSGLVDTPLPGGKGTSVPAVETTSDGTTRDAAQGGGAGSGAAAAAGTSSKQGEPGSKGAGAAGGGTANGNAAAGQATPGSAAPGASGEAGNGNGSHGPQAAKGGNSSHGAGGSSRGAGAASHGSGHANSGAGAQAGVHSHRASGGHHQGGGSQGSSHAAPQAHVGGGAHPQSGAENAPDHPSNSQPPTTVAPDGGRNPPLEPQEGLSSGSLEASAQINEETP